MMERDVIVVGSFNMDLIGYCNEFPKPGETLHGKTFEEGCGGKGANQCISAAKLGAKTHFVAKIGSDAYGSQMMAQLKKFNVDTAGVDELSFERSGVALIMVNKHGQNCIVIYPQANNKMDAEYVREIMAKLPKESVTVCQGEIHQEATLEALKIAHRNGGITIFNAAPAPEKLPNEVYANTTIFCVNESEAEALSGITVRTKTDAERAASYFLEKGCGEVIITMGEEGALYASSGEGFHVQAPKVKAVDTTGAGDAFVGALAFLISKHPNMKRKEMVEKACSVASYAVTKKGTQASTPTLSDLPDDFSS